MTADEGLSRRKVVMVSASAATLLHAGCLGDDDRPTDSPADAGETNSTGDTDSTAQRTADVPAVLPVDPSEDDYLDRSGREIVEVVTRAGEDDEPDYVFDPPFVAVDPGTTIRWINGDDVFHTVTSIPDLTERDGGGDVFDATIGEEGESFEWDAEEPRIQHYYCLPHTGFMWGSIAILDDGSVPDRDRGTDDDSGDDEREADIDTEDFTDVPEELPTSPDDSEFIDLTGESDVEIITRQGREGEPNFVFDPPFVRVDQGATVRWLNRDGIFHTITSTNSLANRSGGGDDFDATITAVGDEFEWEAAERGRQDYYCSPHAGFMFGSIEIE